MSPTGGASAGSAGQTGKPAGSGMFCRRAAYMSPEGGQLRGVRAMRYLRGAAVALVAVAGVALLPMSEASARCWWNGAGWQCGPGLLALPFVAVAGAAAIVTA